DRDSIRAVAQGWRVSAWRAESPRRRMATFQSLRRALSPRGTLVIVGGEDGGRWTGMDRQVRALAISPFVRQRLRMFVNRENREDLQTLTELIEAGKLTPLVDRTYPLADAPEAIRYLEAGRARGKVVITV